LSDARKPDYSVWPLTAAAFLSIFVFAVAANVVAPNLSSIADWFGNEPGLFGARLYWIFPLCFGFFTILWGAAGSRFNCKRLLMLALALLATALGAYALAPVFVLLAVAEAFLGASSAGVEFLGSSFMAELHPTATQRFMNYSQCFYALGAALTPLAAGRMLDSGHKWQTSFAVAAALGFAVLGLVALASYRRPARKAPAMQIRDIGAVLLDARFAVILVAMFFYVGGEMGMARWAPEYFDKTFAVSKTGAALALSLFWLGMLPGRFVAGMVSGRFSTRTILCVGSTGSAVAMALLLLPGHVAWSAYACVAAAGFLAGPVWPTLVARTTTLFGDHVHLRIALVMAAGSLGNAVLSPFMGRIYHTWSLRGAFLVPPASMTLCIGMCILATRKTSARDSGAQ